MDIRAACKETKNPLVCVGNTGGEIVAAIVFKKKILIPKYKSCVCVAGTINCSAKGKSLELNVRYFLTWWIGCIMIGGSRMD